MCCLFGLLDTQHCLSGAKKAALLHALASAAEARGTDASGFAYHTQGKLVIRKAPVPGHLLRFQIPDDTTTVMGHTRMTTQGNERFNRNNHPFRGKTKDGVFALAHNGALWNDRELRETQKLPATNIETDSYIAVQLIEQKKALDFSSLKYMAEQVEGSFTFTILDAADGLYIVKGDSPFCLLHEPRLGLFVYASTGEILREALDAARMPMNGAERITIDSGEIVRIGRESGIQRAGFDFARLYHYPHRTVSYSDELREAAAWMGYPPELIDNFLSRGYPPEELEELLYEGEI